MAAGLGSRYGGLKQIEPIDDMGHIIMDYSIYDAVEAGFKKVILIIKKENEEIFRETIGKRIEEKAELVFAFQELEDIPEGYSVPEGRIKPWGTGQAVRACRDIVDGPFAVINADDYYGKEAFRIVYDQIKNHPDDNTFVMAGYRLGNTLTDNGHVARGVCSTDENSMLTDIHERTMIVKAENVPEELRTEEMIAAGAAYSEDKGESFVAIDADTPVSMNVWGFTGMMMTELDKRFGAFLSKDAKENPQGAEYFLPFVVDEVIKDGLAKVKLEVTGDKWYGVTYKEDREGVVNAFAKMNEDGSYVW